MVLACGGCLKSMTYIDLDGEMTSNYVMAFLMDNKIDNTCYFHYTYQYTLCEERPQNKNDVIIFLSVTK